MEGFAFQYPETCQVVARQGFIAVGSRIELLTVDTGGLSLAEYVNQQLERQVKTSGWHVESLQIEAVGGHEAIRVDYRFGGTNRFGSALFLERAGKVYIWQFTAGDFSCDEARVFRDIYASFQFTQEPR